MAESTLDLLIGAPKLDEEAEGEGADSEMGSAKAKKRAAMRAFRAGIKANDDDAMAEAFRDAFDACMDYSDDEDAEEEA
jgi:hypothetical protein